ncbi:MAG: hypothetical protein JO102_05260, partial [Elusimicrobia bacterium]|nr:hypothetical protein [Elusimicrobiota bacterium]
TVTGGEISFRGLSEVSAANRWGIIALGALVAALPSFLLFLDGGLAAVAALGAAAVHAYFNPRLTSPSSPPDAVLDRGQRSRRQLDSAV